VSAAARRIRGYRLFHRADLSIDEGWTLQAKGPGNADANHRPENVLFGQGEHGHSMAVVLDRDAHGLWSGEGRDYSRPFPNFHRSAAVVRLDEPMAGGWPGLWKVPAPGGPQLGEIDDLERFGLHDTKGTLHTTPYDARHRFASTWAAMFGDPEKQWIWRITMQGGSAGAGHVPTAFKGPWRFTVDELAVYVPEAPAA
jgi:hypothetical protein